METAINMAVGLFAFLGVVVSWAWACEQFIKWRRERRGRRRKAVTGLAEHDLLGKEVRDHHSPDTPQRMP